MIEFVHNGFVHGVEIAPGDCNSKKFYAWQTTNWLIRRTLCVEIFTSQKFHCTKIFVIFFIVRGLTEILYIKNVHIIIMRLIIIMQILEADTDEGVKECFSDEEQCLLLATIRSTPTAFVSL